MKHMLTSALAISAMLGAAPVATAQTDPMIGQISGYGFNWCPRGWTQAAGQLLPISQYSALFSLYGTNYGGDGRTTFGLPDLRGRVPVHTGQAPGLSNYPIGQKTGATTVTLTTVNLASHTHNFSGASAGPDTRSINGATFATFPAGASAYGNPGNLNETMNTGMVGNTGNNQAFNIQSPYIATNYCVSLQGIFPSRN
jgi:microcystin-dependent protein